jgi:hypothetical protein
MFFRQGVHHRSQRNFRELKADVPYSKKRIQQKLNFRIPIQLSTILVTSLTLTVQSNSDGTVNGIKLGGFLLELIDSCRFIRNHYALTPIFFNELNVKQKAGKF